MCVKLHTVTQRFIRVQYEQIPLTWHFYTHAEANVADKYEVWEGSPQAFWHIIFVEYSLEQRFWLW